MGRLDAEARDGSCRGAVGRPCGQLSAQVGTGARDTAMRWCAMFLKALGETTDPTKPGLFARELGRHSFE